MKRGRNQRRRPGANPNRALDSNGPEVRIRGTANQVYDKYVALARDAASAGDRIKAENYLQHAEHYFRVLRAQQPQRQVNGDAAADADAEQPSVDDRGNNRRDDQGRRRNQQRDDASAASDKEKDSKASDQPSEEKPATESAAPSSDEETPPEKKPRRRRTRRAPKTADAADNDATEKAEPEPAAAE